jgi:hypothetical protein
MNELVFTEETPQTGRQCTVKPGATVGRVECDVVLPDPEVSRQHAVFRVVDGRPAVEDLDSRNGTYLNERRISGVAAMSPGDKVRFGKTVWKLEPVEQIPERREAEPATGSEHEPLPSGIRRALPDYVPAPVGSFDPPAQRRQRASAARRLEATIVAYGVVAATAVAVVVYFIAR